MDGLAPPGQAREPKTAQDSPSFTGKASQAAGGKSVFRGKSTVRPYERTENWRGREIGRSIEKSSMIEELADVVLTCDLPEHGLARGDIGTIVLVHKGGTGYEVEFTTLDGETIAIVTLTTDQDRPSKQKEIAHVRDLRANP
jgi:Domain of unknown function (DUF4926)